MNYEAARAQIRTGDLLVWSHGSWKSWSDIQVLAIRVFDTTEYSHIGFAWVVAGRVFVIHAIGRGVTIDPLSTQGSFFLIPMQEAFSEEALEKVFPRVGERYSKWQAVMGFLRKLKIGRDAFWQCAEFVIWVYQQFGKPLCDVATPSAVVRQLQADGKSLIWVSHD